MTVGKPFAMDKSEKSPAVMTKLEAFYDFFVFIGLSIAYIVQVSDNNSLFSQKTFKDNDDVRWREIPKKKTISNILWISNFQV